MWVLPILNQADTLDELAQAVIKLRQDAGLYPRRSKKGRNPPTKATRLNTSDELLAKFIARRRAEREATPRRPAQAKGTRRKKVPVEYINCDNCGYLICGIKRTGRKVLCPKCERWNMLESD